MNFDVAYSRENLLSFLKADFLPQDFIVEKQKINVSGNNYIQEVTKLGFSESLDLVVYEVRHEGKKDPRVGLSKESFKLLAQEFESKALVVFVPVDREMNYRLSYISIELDLTEDGKINKTYSNPRRYSYYLGEGISCYTPNKYLNSGRVKNEKGLLDRFSVEVLTKAFYNELSDWYAWAVKIVRYPNKLDDQGDDDKYNHEAVIRLVTRLIFVWFLKQKKLIPFEFFDDVYISEKLIHGFDPHTKRNLFWKPEDSKYYKAILQNLFFAMLNAPVTSPKGELERRFIKESVNGKNSDFDNKKLMRYRSMFSDPDHFVELANSGVPFLNGGLFDCLDDRNSNNFIDGFSDNHKINSYLVVPDYLFFGEEAGREIDLSEFYGDKKKKRVSARGIIDILKRYNFTVEENTPFDQEVSLDPELLGKVFENLLAMYNPETKATARKQTGSFYTPREIVKYMVDESLVAHLKRTVGEELEFEYRKLMKYTDEDILLSSNQKKEIINSLYQCKILDPACGSGAFPMGVLQQMVHLLSRLDESNEIWKEILLNDAANETSTVLQYTTREEREEAIKDIERSFDENINRPDYARKLYLIEKCIYGVDIQTIAIQISKLRFFISLVIDQKRNDNPLDNFGIRPLPNLEAKFVAANTLVGLNKSEGKLFETEEIKKKEEELKSANHKIFSAKTFKTKTKYKESVKELRSDLSNILQEMNYVSENTAKLLKGWDMFDQNNSSPFFDAEWMFGVQGGFDVVIGNPPYLKEGRASKSVFDAVRTSPYYQGKMDLWYMFACDGVDFLTEGGVLCFIATNNWVTNSGASVMRDKVVRDTKILQVNDFSNFMIFESASIQTMVMLFEKNSNENDYIVDYRRLMGDTTIKDVVAMLNKTKTTQVEYLTPKFNRTEFANKYITFSSNDSLLDKIEGAPGVIYLTSKEIAQGIVFPQDFLNKKNQSILDSTYQIGQGVFGLSDDDLDNMNLSESEYQIIKPLYSTQQINRYYTNQKNNTWVIYTNSSYKNPHSLDNYPNLKNHLDKFTDIITSDNKPYGLHRAREEKFFKGEKVIALRKCVGRPLFSYSDFDTYVSATFYVIKTERFDMKYLTGLLNSQLIKFWLKNRGKMQGFNYQLDKEPLIQIPIALASEKRQNAIATLVDYIVWLKANPNSSINDYVDNNYVAAVVEDIIDALVYECYFLEDFESVNIKILSEIELETDIASFYNKLRTEGSTLLNKLKLMRIKLNELLMPIMTA